MPKISKSTAGNLAVFKELSDIESFPGASSKNIQKPKQPVKEFKASNKKVVITLRITENLKNRLDNYCDVNDTSVNSAVKRAIQDYLRNGGF